MIRLFPRLVNIHGENFQLLNNPFSGALVYFFMATFSALAETNLPPPELTLSGRAGENEAEGVGDLLVPLWYKNSGLLFLNPRSTFNDDSEQEVNIGLGYRHLFIEKQIILAENANNLTLSCNYFHDNERGILGVGEGLENYTVDISDNIANRNTDTTILLAVGGPIRAYPVTNQQQYTIAGKCNLVGDGIRWKWE